MTWESSREYVAEIVRRSLAAGQSIEIEGLGTFRAGAGTCEFIPQLRQEVFIAYAAEDLPAVRRLCDDLKKENCSPWLDKDKLLPGQNWPRAIDQAIELADVFVACFSKRAVSKRGQFQNELRHGLEIARRRPFEEVFIIPVRFEECSVPKRITEQVHYVDLFPDWQRGVRRVIRSIRKGGRKGPLAAWE